jgi:hypothetical protein
MMYLITLGDWRESRLTWAVLLQSLTPNFKSLAAEIVRGCLSQGESNWRASLDVLKSDSASYMIVSALIEGAN